MPYISFDGPKLTKEQKEKLVKKLTEASTSVLSMPKEAFTVVIKENDLENIGVAGELLANKYKK
ncbi:4-oxalocrotonate tautomerase DmpI [Clostridium formicaceticum]|jgi:4-oxalocrotonate tautomerase|uniref:4-oxalocrotonate tautomerase n=1 Tax=Clostridium formicaceticum TaxID=1497 RepID=A0AAC9RFW8_9CLOT|nr:4-oxalocrotonate tautomerase DmpI [Clostridium formicaceticum]AOY75682.1 4-oxalocrotonate tautomerase [Clostridium formicaceticum]ARE85999.1 4-oxalocrotonate tautomerase [Clostridium formicaceticum]